MADVRVMVLRAAGINCDAETVYAWQLAGAHAELVHLNTLVAAPDLLDRVQILTVPGGFSYGDDIAAGTILAARMSHHLADAMQEFVAAGKLVLGICNGFQVLVKMGMLPAGDIGRGRVSVSANLSGKFEERWVRLQRCTQRSPFLQGPQILEMPVAHGEGRVVVDGVSTLDALRAGDHIAFRYVNAAGRPAEYPDLPNGSVDGIAGLLDHTGQVLALMPHPERHVHLTHHPLWTRSVDGPRPLGLELFQSAVESLR